MRSWGFLFSRRWTLFAIVVALLAWAAWWLGEWQFDRLEERKARNAIIERNEAAAPTEVTDVMPREGTLTAQDEWRTIAATGSYDATETVIVRYRTRDGVSGVDVVVPLVLGDGTAILVDRGWVATEDRTPSADDVPAPPDGEVTITGWVRRNGTGDSTAVDDQSTRAISSIAIGEALGDRELRNGFVDLKSEDPEPAEPLTGAELPDLDSGPHFFYGLQWWFFGVLALFGFGYLAWDERRGPESRRRRGLPSEGTEHASVDGEHRARHE